MKKLYTIVSVLFLFLVSNNSAAQVSTNGASGMLTAYGSLAGALSDLNAIGTVTAKVVITLEGNETAPVGGYVLTATGTATDSIVIDGATFTITAPVQGAGSTNDAVIKLVGSDYVAIRNFVIQEQTTTIVLTPVANNTMTEFGIALYGATTTNGAQHNSIQDNTISLNSSYLTSFGILSTCSFISSVTTLGAAPAPQTATTGGENSNNNYYGNNISSVAFGIMIVAPAATAAFKQTGDDIGGASASTGNTISYGNTSGVVAVSYASAPNVAATMGGIIISNAVGASVRYNTVTTAPTFTIATTGIILGFTPATPANSTFTNVVSDNNITINSSATAGTAYGIEFGYGNGATSTATLTAANNTVTINQTTTAATTTTLSGIRTPYSAAATSLTGNIVTINQTHPFTGGTLSGAVNGIIASATSVVIPSLTITGNNITFNQSLQNTTANSLTSPIIGIVAGANLNNITTANINFNNITIKQAVTSSGTFGAGTANYISLIGTLAQQAAFTTLNVNSNNLNTLGSTLRYTGQVAGITHDFTNVNTLSVSNNIINIDRTGVAAGGNNFGIFSSAFTAAGAVSSTISGNGITFSGSMTGSGNFTGINELEGNSTITKNITLDTVILNLPGITGGNQIGINFQTGAAPILGTTTTGSIANSIISITGGGANVTGAQVSGSGIGVLTNINNNTFNLSSSNNAPTILGVNVNGGTRSRVFDNDFSSLAAPNANGNVTIRAANMLVGGANSSFPNEVFNNTVSNVFTFAGAGNATIDGVNVSSGSINTNIYKNKIYGLTASSSGATSLVCGIRVTNPTSATSFGTHATNIYNNYIGFDNAANPNASNVDAIRGIYFVTATDTVNYNVTHNTIYMAAVPSATVTNYGTTGIYSAYSGAGANAAVLGALYLRNNIIVNISTAKGTGRTVAFRRSASTNLLNYNAASNNNLFYAGTPGASNLIFSDGTNFDQTLSAFQTRVGPTRDNASVTENPTFLSTLGSNVNFLHINPAVGTVVESGGGTGTGITDDFDGDIRCPGGSCPGGSTKPDIGADELAGTCPDPIAPSNLVLTGVNPYSGSFTGAVPSPTGGYIVFRTIVNTPPAPIDGTPYTVGNTYVIGVSATVVASGTGTTFGPDAAVGGPPYYYWVFSFNTGCGTTPNYSTTATSAIAAACAAPTQPTLLNLTAISSSQIDGSFTASGASGYLVIRTKTAAPPPNPVNSTTYTAGQIIGSPNDTVVVYSGTGTSFSATGLSGSTTYYFWVYGYNTGCIGTPTYNAVAPLNANLASLPCLVPGTYTVGPGGNYTSVGAVMTALSCFTFPPLPVPLTGAYFFEFLPTYNSSVETFPLVISPVYNPAAHLITFRPQTGATGISITSGNTAGTLLFQGIALNQAPTYFVFDGRPGGLGVAKELTIQNTNVGSSYAIQFENGANNNTIQYCKIRSAHNGTSGGGGTINFASSNSTAGNSTNTIANNDIYNAAGGTPTNAIYSNGLSTAPNNSNVISANSIYDHFNATYTTAGINLGAYSSNWTISGNSFYQTAARTFTSATATYNAILAAATTVGGLSITGNFIGGTLPSATGGFTTIGGNGILRAIQLTTGTVATSVQNNLITNIDFTSSNSSSAQSLISLVSGVINVGTVTGNNLGSQVATNRITVSLSDNTAGVNFAGILATSTVTTDIFAIRNNTIGGITVSGTSTSAGVQGINFSGATGADTVRNNIIGSNVASSFSNGLNTTLTGILGNSSNTTPTQIISGNTIVNLSATNTGTNSYVTGISVAGLGKYAIGNTANAGNLIYDLRSAGSNSINYNATGIVNAATTTGQFIVGNTIRNITSTAATADVGVVGIYYNGATGANTIESNNIHSFNLASTNVNSIITGIQAQGGAASYYNNMVRLGISNTGVSITSPYGIYGLTENGGTNSFYMNSIYVGGTGVVGAGSDSYAFFGANTGTQDIRNNIFWNARSNTSAAVPNHYAMVLTSNSGIANINFNDILSTGTNGKVLAYYGTQQLTLSSWCTAIGASIAQWYSSLPGYFDPTAATPDLHINTAAITVVEQGGTPALTPTNDIDVAARAGLTPHDLGADAFISSIPPVLIDGSITALVSPVSGFACYGSNETVTVTFKNNSASALNFATTPVTINVDVTGATVRNFTTTINTGSLAAGASQNVTLPSLPLPLNMTFVGTYIFTCTFSVASPGVDRDITNDELLTTRLVSALGVGTATASPSNFCGVASGTPTITLASAGGGSIQWYEATAIGGPYTAVGTNSLSYTPLTPINTVHYYRATVSCGVSNVTSNTVTVNISTPQLISTSGNQSSCGPSSFTFSGVISGNSTTVLRWYDASTGALAYTGTPFVTPVLSSTTTYSARAVDTSSTPVSATFGIGTSTNTTTGYPAPYTNWYGGTKHQMLILASELTAAGVTAGDFTSLTLYVASVGSTFSGSLNNFSIYMGSTAAVALTSTFLPVSSIPVYTSANEPIVVGPNTHTFTSNFAWDGTSNIIIQTSYSNGNVGGSSDNVLMYYTPTSFNSMNYNRQDGQTAATILATTTGNGTSPVPPSVNRPNMTLGYKPFCSSAASPVTATINPAPTTVSLLSTTGSITNSSADTITICTDSAKLVVSGGTTTQNSSVTVASPTLNLAIVDPVGGVPSNITSGLSVTMPLGATIDSIRVKVNLTHTFDGDLNIHLRSPNNQVVNLISRRGGSGEDMINTQVSSNAANGSMATGTAPFNSGLFRADLATITTTTPATTTNTFSSLFVAGTGAAQTWTISVHDMAAADLGNFENWSITIFYQEPIAVPYLWSTTTPNTVYTNSGLSSPYTNQNINTVFVKPTADTNYVITATLGGCSKKDTVHVKAFNISTAASAVNVSPSSACSGASITLTQTGGTLGTGASWNWYSNPGFTTLVGTSVAADASLTIAAPAINTTYYLRSEGGTAPCTGNIPSGASTTFTVSPVNTWLGVNTDWNDAANWCPGIPTSATNVTIPTVGTGFYPNVAAAAACNNITITGAGTVTVAATGTLSIAGSITNTGDSIDATAGTINFIGVAAQTLRANHFKSNTIANLTINNTNTVTGVTIDNTGVMLKVTGTVGFGALNNAKLTTSDKLTLISNAAGTARIGDVTNNSVNTGNDVVGKVVVERYVDAGRSWRLLTSPIMASTLPVPNIFNQWQESAQSTTLGSLADPNPGYGTHVSKGLPYVGTFDQNNTGNSSIFYLTPSGWGGSPTTTSGTVAGTNTGVITDHPAYMLFVRGNRATNLAMGTAAPTSSTVLRNTGNLYVTSNSATPEVINGSGAYVVGANTYYSFPNPYPSAISFERIFNEPLNSTMQNIFYVWDANITGSSGVGGWVTVTRTGAFTYSTSPNTPSMSTGEIQSGSAFMMNYPGGGATLRYKEPFKVTGSNFSLLRPVPGNQIRTTLIASNADGTTSINDGTLAIFNSSYSDVVNKDDANKMPNFAENICIVKDGIDLAIEKRKSIVENDTVFFKISKMRSKNYSLSFDLEGITCGQGLSPILEDLHLNTKTALNIEGNTSYNFNIVLNTASADPNRFRIVFKKLVTYTGIHANVADEDVMVNWNVSSEFGIDRYEIERSVNGTSFSTTGNKISEGNSDRTKIYTWLDLSPVPGVYYYRIKCIGKNGVVSYSDVAKVTVVKSAPAMFVFPNPVTSNTIRLQMNKMPGGVYETVLLSEDGKVINRSRISHVGGTATETISPKAALPNGNYRIEVIGPDMKRTVLKIMVQK